jgi:hypothetical protein
MQKIVAALGVIIFMLSMLYVHPVETTSEPTTIYIYNYGMVEDVLKYQDVQNLSTPSSAIMEELKVQEYVEWRESNPIIFIPKGGLTQSAGVFNGPSGKETYYNLNMSGVVGIMRSIGYSEDDYPYWVRQDGVKMLGPYVMVAAALDIRPRGSLIATSKGTGIVCDTGTFIYSNPYQLDVATAW